MNILLVDDEPHARERLRRQLEELGGAYRIVGEASDGTSAIAQCVATNADLVLLDVRIPGPDGLHVAEHLARLEPPPAVILVTAFPQYALEAFERHIADYLVKPVRTERLREALERLPLVHRVQRDAETAPRRHLNAAYRGGIQTVAIEDVLYLHAEQKYVLARHIHGTLLLDESLRVLEQAFPEDFVRIHRGTLVARRHLIALETTDGNPVAVVRGLTERLPISRRHLPSIRRLLRAR